MNTRIPLAILAFALLASPAAAAPATTTVVMSHLDNPRGIAMDYRGALYVAEAGHGGVGPCAVLRGVQRCYGPSGAVSRLWHGRQERIAVGLPSYADAEAFEVTGPHDVSVYPFGYPFGRTFVTIGWGDNPAKREVFGPAGRRFGTLVRILPHGRWRVVADVSAYEARRNPAGGPVDSNPYGLLDGSTHVVADAGANALLRVLPGGRVWAIATFRSRPADATDAVPTSVVRGPDGALYVGELTGAPFLAGMARVYRIVPGRPPRVFLEGFKTIIDLAFGPDRSLYVLEHATGPVFFGGPGRIVRVRPDGSHSVVIGGLVRPTSLLVDRRGTIYVTNKGLAVLGGEVLRVDP